MVALFFSKLRGDAQMRMRKTSTRISSMLVVLLAVMLVVASLATAVEVGDKAPDFTLPSTMGKKVSLSQYKGKNNVLVEFFIAAASRTGT